MNIKEHQAFLKLIDDMDGLNLVVAKQGIQIAALIAAHPEPEKIEAILNPPPAANAWAELDAPPVSDITIPERVRAKPGPKPKFHGLHPASPELGAEA